MSAAPLAALAAALRRARGCGTRWRRSRARARCGALGGRSRRCARARREGRRPSARRSGAGWPCWSPLCLLGRRLAARRPGRSGSRSRPAGRGSLRRRARAAAALPRRAGRGAPAVARALADALAGGHSIRGAIAEAARGVDGAAGGRELARARPGARARRAAGGGARRALQARAGTAAPSTRSSPRSCSSATPAATSRGSCASSPRARGGGRRLERDARAATAQARFTGVLVGVLPVGAAALAELASPGYLAGAAAQPAQRCGWPAAPRLPPAARRCCAIQRLGAGRGVTRGGDARRRRGASCWPRSRLGAARRRRSARRGVAGARAARLGARSAPCSGRRLGAPAAPRDLDARLEAAGRPLGLAPAT